MLKFLKILIFSIIVLIIFNKQIISYTSLFFLSKWTDREIKVKKFEINYKKKTIIIDSIQIKNPNEFYYNNFFESEKIFIKYDFASLFSELIIINNLIIEKPKFFLEVIKKSDIELSPFNTQEMYGDNVGGVEKIIKTQPKKIWPKKNKDTNFLILDVKINGLTAFLKTPLSQDSTKVNLSNIHYKRIGNGGKDGNYIHHKDALKLIYYNLIGKIGDSNLRNFLKKIYNYKSLLGIYSEEINSN